LLGWGSIRELGNQGAAGSQCLGGECLSVPVPVSGLTDVTAIAAGGTHSLALLRNGTVVAWGLNDTGQLGTGNFGGDVTVPVAVQGLRDATGITAGEGFSLAVRRNGTVWAWGTGASGQLGTGRISGSAVPVPVLGATDVVSVAAGFAHSLALRRDGTVLAWGDNRGNGLATGSTGVRRHCAGAGSCRTKPAHVLGLGKVIAIAAGGGATVGDFSLAQA